MLSAPDPLLRAQFSPLASFDVRLSPEHGAERFHVLQSGDAFYLRLHKHPDWLGVLEIDDQLAWLAARKVGGSERHQWQERIVNREWGRVLSLPAPRGGHEIWRLLWKGKRSFLMRAETSEVVDFSSTEEWKRGAWIQPGAYFLKKFVREWNTSTSDVRRAFEFLSSGDETRRLWGVQWQRGSWDEMKSILRAAAVVEYQWGERIVVQSRPIDGKVSSRFGSNAPQSGRLLRLIARLEEQNVAVLRDKSQLRRLAPHPFNFSFGVAKWPELRVEVDAPSEHERLEARLELRDWLRTGAPDLLGEWS